MMTVALHLIRHGHTASNGGSARPRMSGWADLPLSARGRAQVERLRRRLSAGAPFDRIYASPLTRTVDTATPLVDSGLGPLELCGGLKEINCGEVDGWLVDRVQEAYPDHWRANLRQEDDDFRWPGGESYRELRARCVGAVCAIAARHPGGRIAVVTHAGVITQVLGHVLGRPPARWEAYRPDNASITEVRWSGAGGQLLSFNDRMHLEDEARAAAR